MKTVETHIAERPVEYKQVSREIKLLRDRVNRLLEELEEQRLRTEGQVCRLAKRVARLESATPAVQCYNGT